MKGKREEGYFVGFDIGTDSVGYAVTDKNYNILRCNGKAMWGSRLFDSANPAEERRIHRTGRRRLQRKTWRIGLLQELFAEEISKVDAGFFVRMKESHLLAEDKEIMQINSLFYGGNYKDVDFHREFPTIYHLRKKLITENKVQDVRLVYLALHHIIKHRGHFLFSGTVENATSFQATYDVFCKSLYDEYEMTLECSSLEELAAVLKDKHRTKKDKNNKVMELLHCDKTDKQKKAIIGLICGSKCKLSEVFADESLLELERTSLSFSEGAYEEIRPELEDALQERCGILDIIKSVYDWAILADILAGGEYEGISYLSVAKVNLYEKHRKDLELLKRLLKSYSKEVYKDFFEKSGKDNYCAYIGALKKNGKKLSMKKCTREDFLKRIKKLIPAMKDIADMEIEVAYIEQEIESDTFLPLQVSKENGVIPYQVHGMELRKILQNAEAYLDFLKDKDEEGISVSEKIIKLFEFRIPYYIGPLNTAVGNNSWMERKGQGRITPWNFAEMVDEDKSAQKFIRRMTNKCTYLTAKDVLPKNSLLYCEFMVWNELNNVRLGENKLPVEVKQTVFCELFKRKKRVTGKALREYLVNAGLKEKGVELSGFDQNFKASLTSYLDFKKIFGEAMEQYSVQKMVESIILWITLYGEESRMLKRVIRSHYGIKEISEKQLAQICHLRYQGWGRLSKEFLTDIIGTDTETGEMCSIIQALRNTNDNLMQLLSQKYTYLKEVEEENKKEFRAPGISYDELIKDTAASPAIKRSAWQVILIAEEIKKIMGKEPEKIFIEMARGPEEKKNGKGERKDSRKEQLLKLYANCKEEERDWITELKGREEGDFKSLKLFLYYTQMGRDMYEGKPIDLSALMNTNTWDRDHIYPQSKTKDDSLDNLVLVRKTNNADKSDRVISADIQEKMAPFWRELKEKGFITEEKYRRLMRKTPLTDEELAGFISRQLVETRQSAKVVANLFQKIYQESRVVYVKAAAVAEFRKNTVKRIKVRELNDYHHAKDAYLNIVVGNVYDEKFTSNPLTWLKNSKDKNYSLNRMFDFDLSKNGKTIWAKGEKGTLETIRKYMDRNDVLYTRYAASNKGGFFDQQPRGKNENPTVPLKKGMDVKKYGGYKTVTPAYFALLESEDKKGRKQRSIESVPLYLESQFQKNSGEFLNYCTENYGLKNPRIIIPKIKKNAYLVIDGFPMHLRGTTGKQLVLQGAAQLLLDNEKTAYLKKVEKYIQRNLLRTDKRTLLSLNEYDGITREENEKLFDELCKKQSETIFKYRPANQYKNLVAGKERFLTLTMEQQCIVLNEILHLLQCKPVLADLALVGGSSNAGKACITKMISNCKSARLIHQSVTGIFEQEIDLLTV